MFFVIGGKRNRGGKLMAGSIWEEKNGRKKMAGTGTFSRRYLFFGSKMEPTLFMFSQSFFYSLMYMYTSIVCIML